MTFQIRRSGTQYYFRIVASNSETLASSERYWNKSDCLHAVGVIKAQAGSGVVIDQT